MKMKVVIKVSMNDQKSRKKALKTVVGCLGVESAAVQGNDKDLVEVIGEGIDPVKITTLLRKNVGYSEIVSVGEVKKKEEKKEEKKEDPPKPVWIAQAQPYAYNYSGYNTNYTVPYQPIYEVRDSDSDSCSIM